MKAASLPSAKNVVACPPCRVRSGQSSRRFWSWEGWRRLALGVYLWRSSDPEYAAYELAFHTRFHRYDEIIQEVAKRRGVDPMLVKAVVWRESRFQPAMRGLDGERGLMQITDAAAKEWAKSEKVVNFVPTDLFDPKTNIDAGRGCWRGHCGATEARMTRCRSPWRSTTRAAAGSPKWSGSKDGGDAGEVVNSEKLVANINIASTKNYVETVQEPREISTTDAANSERVREGRTRQARGISGNGDRRNQLRFRKAGARRIADLDQRAGGRKARPSVADGVRHEAVHGVRAAASHKVDHGHLSGGVGGDFDLHRGGLGVAVRRSLVGRGVEMGAAAIVVEERAAPHADEPGPKEEDTGGKAERPREAWEGCSCAGLSGKAGV